MYHFAFGRENWFRDIVHGLSSEFVKEMANNCLHNPMHPPLTPVELRRAITEPGYRPDIFDTRDYMDVWFASQTHYPDGSLCDQHHFMDLVMMHNNREVFLKTYSHFPRTFEIQIRPKLNDMTLDYLAGIMYAYSYTDLWQEALAVYLRTHQACFGLNLLDEILCAQVGCKGLPRLLVTAHGYIGPFVPDSVNRDFIFETLIRSYFLFPSTPRIVVNDWWSHEQVRKRLAHMTRSIQFPGMLPETFFCKNVVEQVMSRMSDEEWLVTFPFVWDLNLPQSAYSDIRPFQSRMETMLMHPAMIKGNGRWKAHVKRFERITSPLIDAWCNITDTNALLLLIQADNRTREPMYKLCVQAGLEFHTVHSEQPIVLQRIRELISAPFVHSRVKFLLWHSLSMKRTATQLASTLLGQRIPYEIDPIPFEHKDVPGDPGIYPAYLWDIDFRHTVGYSKVSKTLSHHPLDTGWHNVRFVIVDAEGKEEDVLGRSVMEFILQDIWNAAVRDRLLEPTDNGFCIGTRTDISHDRYLSFGAVCGAALVRGLLLPAPLHGLMWCHVFSEDQDKYESQYAIYLAEKYAKHAEYEGRVDELCEIMGYNSDLYVGKSLRSVITTEMIPWAPGLQLFSAGVRGVLGGLGRLLVRNHNDLNHCMVRTQKQLTPLTLGETFRGDERLVRMARTWIKRLSLDQLVHWTEFATGMSKLPQAVNGDEPITFTYANRPTVRAMNCTNQVLVPSSVVDMESFDRVMRPVLRFSTCFNEHGQ